MELARRYLIRGHVQGVGYRYFTQRLAVRLGVRGWVRNRPDGDVEVQAQASATVLQSFRSELERGPRSSHVREVIEQPLELGQFSTFDIR
jgi:acylphosphatase